MFLWGMANSELLGARHTVTLPSGTIEYSERGTGTPVVFVHGLLVNADLWRNVVPAVADAGFRCLAPDWPLGSHTVPMPPAADLSPPGVAGLIAEFLDTLDLADVTLVANDTGGALVQLLMTRHPERIGRVVLTPCDAFEYFFPPGFAYLPKIAAVPGAVWSMTRALSIPAVQHSSLGFGMTSRQRIPADVLASYTAPARRDAGVRRDLRRFLRGVHNRYTLAAAELLPSFTKPVLLVGAENDRVFPAALAARLAALLPDSRQVTVADSYTFIPEDQPAELAKLVVEFMSG
ncbi:MAG TPA: alpha/beta hydrolase [Pseudonocardiaceae bacterium]|jgi:pimeloyl-ACP methyl ester carboxylesterase|nr:alpha/beta hydrolase [Pseudonocardiaceae bacterium]